MRNILTAVCVAAALLAVGACQEKRDTQPKIGAGVNERYTDGYYDGYYGPYLGGYWHSDGRYYFKDNNVYKPDTGGHFRHEPAPGFVYFQGVAERGDVGTTSTTTTVTNPNVSHSEQKVLHPDGSISTNSQTVYPDGSSSTTTVEPSR